MREAGTVVALLAAAVIVLGGLAATVRVMLRIRDELRDNTSATRDNTKQLGRVAGRLNLLETRVGKLERRRANRLQWPYPPATGIGPPRPVAPGPACSLKLAGPGHFS